MRVLFAKIVQLEIVDVHLVRVDRKVACRSGRRTSRANVLFETTTRYKFRSVHNLLKFDDVRATQLEKLFCHLYERLGNDMENTLSGRFYFVGALDTRIREVRGDPACIITDVCDELLTAVWRRYASADNISRSNTATDSEQRRGRRVINLTPVERQECLQFDAISWGAASLDPAMGFHFDDCGGSRVTPEAWLFDLIMRCAMEPAEVEPADGDVEMDAAVAAVGDEVPWASIKSEKGAKVQILLRPRGARCSTRCSTARHGYWLSGGPLTRRVRTTLCPTTCARSSSGSGVPGKPSVLTSRSTCTRPRRASMAATPSLRPGVPAGTRSGLCIRKCGR